MIMFMGTYVILKEFQHFIAYKNKKVNNYILYYQSTAYVLILLILKLILKTT